VELLEFRLDFASAFFSDSVHEGFAMISVVTDDESISEDDVIAVGLPIEGHAIMFVSDFA